MPITQTNETYQWIIGILIGLLLTVGAGLGGSLITASALEGDLQNHSDLPAHPVSQTRWQSTEYRLERIEDKQDMILEILRRESRLSEARTP